MRSFALVLAASLGLGCGGGDPVGDDAAAPEPAGPDAAVDAGRPRDAGRPKADAGRPDAAMRPDAAAPGPDAAFEHSAEGPPCGECHTEQEANWAASGHAWGADKVLLDPAYNATHLLSDECLPCHSPLESAGHIGDFVQPVDQVGPWALVAAPAAPWRSIGCPVCHDPSSKKPRLLAFYDGKTRAYQPVASVNELCEKCHLPGTEYDRGQAGSVHFASPCTDCHLQKKKMLLSAKDSCAKCHWAQTDPSNADPSTRPCGRTCHYDPAYLDTTAVDPASPNDIHTVACTDCHPPL